jgi:hypothetical protein
VMLLRDRQLCGYSGGSVSRFAGSWKRAASTTCQNWLLQAGESVGAGGPHDLTTRG